jgi:hypothetical protein
MSRTVRIFSLFVMTVFSVVFLSSNAIASTATPPIPLRIMYLKSDLVLIGTVTGAGQWEPAARGEAGEGKSPYQRVLTVTVEAPIKGTAPGELAVTEFRSAGDFANTFSAGERRIFFLAAQGNSYYLLSNFHGDLSLGARELDIYAARLRELQNIYLSGDRTGAQIVDWLAALAADPVTRFEGAEDLKTLLGITGLPTRESGSSIDPSGRLICFDNGFCVDPDGRSSLTVESDVGSRLDPNGRNVQSTDNGGQLDPNGRLICLESGSCIDPDGKSSATKKDTSSLIDPNGKKGDQGPGTDPDGKGLGVDPNGRGGMIDPNGKGDQGGGTDPDGRAKGEQGGGLDPDGRKVRRGSAARDSGSAQDPDGKSSGRASAARDSGSALDPDGKSLISAKGDQRGMIDPEGRSSCLTKESGCSIDPNGRGPLIDPDGHGSSMDPNGKGLGVDPNGKSSVTKKGDDGRGIDPNGRGFSIDPNGKDAGGAMDPNGKGWGLDPNGKGAGVDPNGKGLGVDPNGKTGDNTDAGPRMDPEGRSVKGQASREAGVIIDPNGRGAGLDPNGAPGDGKDAGPQIDPDGRGAAMDPNGDSGPATDPNGRLFTAANREQLIQAFLATNLTGAPLSQSDAALLSVVSMFHDSRVNLKLASAFPLFTAGTVSADILQSAARSFGDARLEKLARLYALTLSPESAQKQKPVDEWDDQVVKRNAAAAAAAAGQNKSKVDEWDGDILKRGVDEWDVEVVKRDSATKSGGVDEWDGEVVKRGLSGDPLRAELLRLIRDRVQLLASH